MKKIPIFQFSKIKLSKHKQNENKHIKKGKKKQNIKITVTSEGSQLN